MNKKFNLRQVAVAACLAIVVTLGGLAGCANTVAGSGDIAFPLTVDSIAKMDCTKVQAVKAAIVEAHGFPDGTPARGELATKWGIPDEAAYTAALVGLDAKQTACNAAALKPSQSTSASATATQSASATATSPSSATPPPIGMSSAPASSQAPSTSPSAATLKVADIRSWGDLLRYLDQSGKRAEFLSRVDAAKDQLGFSSTDVLTWAKMDNDFRLAVALDDKALTDQQVRDLANKQATHPLSTTVINIVHGNSSYQIAGGPRVTASGDGRVMVILAPLAKDKNDQLGTKSGVVLNGDLNLVIYARVG